MTDDEFAEWLRPHADALETPAYIYDLERIDQSIGWLRGILPDDTQLLYSLKANPQAGILQYLADHDVGAETASMGEKDLCDAAGLKPECVLIGGVAKSRDDLRSVIGRHAGIVIDSPGEWTKLRDALVGDQIARVMLRINPGVALGGLDMAGSSQFGISVGQALEIARQCQLEKKVEFLGLHAYFGSQRLKIKPIVATANAVADAIDEFRSNGVDVPTVNIGLGCGVPYLENDEELPYDELRDALATVWLRDTWQGIDLWSEAGRAFVGRCGYYIARVVDRKERGEDIFVYLDGGLNAHNPGLGLGRFFHNNPRFLFSRRTPSEGPREKVQIVGNLCTSADRIGKDVETARLSPGDVVVIPNSGAYCATTAMWGFNSQPLFREALLQSDGRLEWLEPQCITRSIDGRR